MSAGKLQNQLYGKSLAHDPKNKPLWDEIDKFDRAQEDFEEHEKELQEVLFTKGAVENEVIYEIKKQRKNI